MVSKIDFRIEDIIWNTLTTTTNPNFTVNVEELLEISPLAKIVSFRAARADYKARIISRFSEPSQEVEVRSLNAMLLMIGIGWFSTHFFHYQDLLVILIDFSFVSLLQKM